MIIAMHALWANKYMQNRFYQIFNNIMSISAQPCNNYVNKHLKMILEWLEKLITVKGHM